MRLLKVENIAPLVHSVRGEKVLFDADLAPLYGVATKVLNQAAKRNSARFPEDFMFRLSLGEWERIRSQNVTASSSASMRSQIVTASRRNVGRAPYAFTEQGVAMLSSVLRSPRAIERQLARKIEAMEKKYDEQFAVVFDAIKRLIAEEEQRKPSPRRRIGFVS